MRKYALFMAGFLLSCGAPEADKQSTAVRYFDLKGYFTREAGALNRRAPLVNKTVMVNNNAENKQLKISNWEKELSAFIDADINKPAWQGAFIKRSNGAITTFTSNNEKVPVKSVQVTEQQGNIISLLIIIQNQNYLYSSSDTLSYYPDSLYKIRKTQQIKLMSPKQYQITGTF